MGYQIYELIRYGKASLNLLDIAKFYFNDTDTVSSLAVIKVLNEYPSLFAVLAIPTVFVIAKTLWNLSQVSKPSKKTMEEMKKDVLNRPHYLDSWFFSLLSVLPTLSSLLFLHPMKRKIPSLATIILWEGEGEDLSDIRNNAFTALLELAEARDGVTQMTALQSLAYLAHGMHIKNLKQSPKDVEDLLKIKVRALHALEERYRELPDLSLNKLRTTILLWEIGQNKSWRASIAVPILKAIGLAFYAWSLWGLGKVLYEYIRCPAKYLNNFTWLGGTQPYASDYSKDCFDEQVRVFNLIPGQPAYTLVGRDPASTVAGNLSSYYFPNGLYDLDLSNKNLNGSVIADIVEAFKKANATVSLNSLNIAKNAIANSSDLARILAVLPPSITKLDMYGVDQTENGFSVNSFLWLRRLTGLQSLNVSDNSISPSNNSVMGEILQNLYHLQELRLELLSTNLTQVAQALKPNLTLLDLNGCTLCDEDQIALGKALARNLTLHQLYLCETAIGASSEGNIALAQGLAAQTQLRVLDVSANCLCSSNVLRSLSSSLTSLSIGNNGITEISSINAVSQAINNMTRLKFFNSGGNLLGNFPNFLKALQGKQNLTLLDLSYNGFNNTNQMSDLLQTTLNLEVLDLSYNNFTDGSLLIPILPNLRKLKSLNLVGNLFTTEDRLEIWKATSFLHKSPFSLDDDLNYTIGYFQNLPSNTTSLNFAGLILNDPTAFETIMNQTVDRFPNLEELDFSSNIIVDRDPITHNLRTEGIEALIVSLPQLKNLQSLKMLYGQANSPDADIYYQNLSYTIGQLSSLHSLNLAGTNFLFADSLGKGLEKSHSLTSVNLAACWSVSGFSPSKWQGGVQLIQGLQAHPHLTDLILCENPIGFDSSLNSDPNSTYALADALKSWPQLQFLNLALNKIGWKDPKSSSYFLKQLADLPATVHNKIEKTLEVNLFGGIYNITWTNESHVFQNLTERSILDACAKQLCWGGNITTQPKTKAPEIQEEPRIEQKPVTSSASPLVPFYQPLVNSLKPWFSVESWSAWGDGVLDSVAHTILNYSKQVVKNAPGYYPGTLDSSKSVVEGRNKTFRNYPISHFRVLDQSEPLDVQKFNHIQALPQTQEFNYTSLPPMLTSGFQPLMLSK